MITDVKTPNIEMVKLKTDHDYVYLLQTRGQLIKREPKIKRSVAEIEILKLAKKEYKLKNK